MKFGRMIYFDDLIKDLWFVIGFSKIRCHGNQMSLFHICLLLEDVKNQKSLYFTAIYYCNCRVFYKIELLVLFLPKLVGSVINFFKNSKIA